MEEVMGMVVVEKNNAWVLHRASKMYVCVGHILLLITIIFSGYLRECVCR